MQPILAVNQWLKFKLVCVPFVFVEVSKKDPYMVMGTRAEQIVKSADNVMCLGFLDAV